MDLKLLQQAEPYTKRHRRRSIWSRLVRFLSCVVVFCTTYALILPAITQEREAFCGQNPHVHEEACYTRIPEIQYLDLTCTYDSLHVHIHSSDCYDDDGCVLCGQSDYIVHEHDSICYDEEGLLLCKLPEREQHQHSDDCSHLVGAHTHDEGCFIYHQGELLCEETAAHDHSDDCYGERELICETPEDHTHSGSCYIPGELSCGEAEGHSHTEDCYDGETLICPEHEGHRHDDSCYGAPELTCEIPEAHTHDDSCFTDAALICEDADLHVHGDDCYEQIPELVCTLEEAEGEMTLVCTEPEAEIHVHTEECFEMVTKRDLLCTLEEDDEHTHDDECYGILELTCELEEHEHDLTCYSDLTADTETAEDWEFLLLHVERTGNPAGDLLAIARSQLGYEESDVNYIVSEEDELPQGYTRYGEWYGEPYSDWNALFAAFCITYAEALPLPESMDLQDWLDVLSEECAVPAEDTPSPGELIFFDLDGDGCADRVGIVSGMEEPSEEDLSEEAPVEEDIAEEPSAVLLVIEGDAGGQVREVSYDPDDNTILARLLPGGLQEDPIFVETLFTCGIAEHTHAAECYDETETLICEIEEHIHHDIACTELVQRLCLSEEHTHGDECYDEADTLLCQLAEHIHDASCSIKVLCLCGFTEHRHTIDCYDADASLICELKAHTHKESCFMEDPYVCGYKDHFHEDNCYDENGAFLCPLEEHEHTIVCTADLSDLTEEEYRQVERVILAIDELLSWEEIEAQIEEFEENEDYEGEEIWLTELYQEVGIVHDLYLRLREDLEPYIFNRDKLLDLEFIWSMAILADIEIGVTTPYHSSLFSTPGSFVFYTQGNDGRYYAFDGNGMAVPVTVDSSGLITAGISDKSALLWNISSAGSGSYTIRNAATGAYMHAHSGGVTTTGAWSSVPVASGSGVKIRSNSEYAQLNLSTGRFTMTRDANSAATYQIGILQETTVHLDGTNGDLLNLRGSPKSSESVRLGGTYTLPETWTSPSKYAFRLKGWYDVKNGNYYQPGETITVTEELLFYADWVAETYDIGQFNSHVADTVSTNNFITTHVFDYNALFNTLSQSAIVNGNTADWTLVESGTVANTGEETLNFIFVDYDGTGDITYPRNRNDANGIVYTEVSPGLYDETLTDLLFNPETEVIGKEYIGTGDHLFQYGFDPSDTEHYGYYYYDSRLHSASYNQSDGRFYVYNYLTATADSLRDGDSYADFLPLNSPYANTNGKSTGTYEFDGYLGEYDGVTHLFYDTKNAYSNSEPYNSTNHITSNFFFGMNIQLDFYLPNQPGTQDSGGIPANQSITGENMVFEFSGDDDVWILIDGELVLDIGGIHGIEHGYIDFSTGDVVVADVVTGNIRDLAPGSHTLTMYYMERGSSKSNFKLRFNLSTRYSMTLRKEDTLTAKLLDGAEFSVYTDAACTQPAELWADHAAHERGDASTNVFTVENGKATMWGFAPGNTYYLVETLGPTSMGGVTAKGIIRMRLNNHGQPDYEVLPDKNEELTVGYTIHGYKVNEDTQEAFLSVTNMSPDADTEPTEIYVEKKWSDGGSHDPITVYLIADGVRIQSVTLSEYNNWKHTWTNMPKEDNAGNPVTYTVREATVPGYVGKVTTFTPSSGGGGVSGDWVSADGFENGETYLLKTASGYLSAADGKLYWETNADTAKNASASQWIVTVHSSDTISLKNNAGMTLYYKPTAFYVAASPDSESITVLNFSDNKLFYYKYHDQWYQERRYMSTNIDTYNGVIYTVENSSDSNALAFTLYQQGSAEPPPVTSDDNFNFRITNTPIGDAKVSLTVNKEWDLGNLGTTDMYLTRTVEMDLLADGEETGLTGTLNYQNGWSYTFTNLPQFDSDGVEIEYTVKEVPFDVGWNVTYGPVTENGENAYETTVTNTYAMTYQLPETGGHGLLPYTIGGALLVIASGILLLYPYNTKRKKEGHNSS